MHDPAIRTTVELVVALLAALLFIGLAVRRVRLPLSVALVAFGLLVAILAPHRLTISPELVLLALLPGLVFEAAFRLHLEDLRRVAGRVVLLAVPGVLFMALVVALTLHLATGMSLSVGFVLGAILSATDPVAVVNSMRESGAPRQLATLVEAESLFNDGTGVLLFGLALAAVNGTADPLGQAAGFVVAVVASGAIGVAFGYLATRVMVLVDDHLLELTLTALLAYGTYLVADGLGQSGIIATVSAGIVLGSYGRRVAMSARTRDRVDVVWEFVAFVLTALVFLLIGLTSSFSDLAVAVLPIAAAVFAIVVGRAIVIYGWIGALRWLAIREPRLPGVLRPLAGEWRSIAAMPVGWLHVASWAGLRGAVAFALALALPVDLPERPLLQEVTFGVVLFTVLVQGATARWVTVRSTVNQSESPA